VFISGSLRRYTSVLAVLDTLTRARITLLDPATWSDRNDRELMAHYAATTPGNVVFAYCMAEGHETAHHWQVFADRGWGARMVFDRARLVEAISADPLIRHEAVGYANWRDLGASVRFPESLPFLKRQVFRAEREYRLIATPPATHTGATYELAIPLNCIISVYVSGEISVPHFETLKGIIADIPACKRLPVRHSGLLQNPNWAKSLRLSTARLKTPGVG
jgi:hypothetical protein